MEDPTILIKARTTLLLDSALILASSLPPLAPDQLAPLEAEQTWSLLGNLPPTAFRWSLVAGLLLPGQPVGVAGGPPVWVLELELVRGGDSGVKELIAVLRRLASEGSSFDGMEEVMSCHELAVVVRGAVWRAVQDSR